MSHTKGALQKITLPHKMVEKYRKIVLKKELRKHQAVRKYKGPVVISCKKKIFNHYQGQTYSNFNPQHLASQGWRKNKAKGDYFTINATKRNPAFNTEEDVSTFSQLGILQNISEVLETYGINSPTEIQAKCIPHLLNGKNILYTAETGSGKTLAFLLPIVQKLLQRKAMGMYESAPSSPGGVILVPSRELADQIHTVASDLTESLPLTSMSLCGGRGTQKILKYKPQHVADIVVATPGVLSKILTNRLYSLEQLSCIVLDEVDTLMDDTFSARTLRIIKRLSEACGSLGSETVSGEQEDKVTGVQMVMSGATIPRSLDTIVKDVFPLETFLQVKTDHVNKILSHVSHKFYRTLGGDKPELLLKHLKQNVKKGVPTMVFCNKTDTVKFLKSLTDSAGVDCIVLHAQTSQQRREGLFQRFQNGEKDVLISTDIASRGLDTVRVQHVINYDFPLFMSDYLHRAGRVGRVASHNTGAVFNFVSSKWDVDLLWQIEASVRRTKELHNVNANIKRKITGIVTEKYQKDVDIL